MKKGDFVKIEFIGRIESTGDIFDLTSADLAKEKNIYNKNYKYQPTLVVIGAKMVIPGVEKKLEKMKPGDEKEFTVKPDDAFGKRDTRLVKIVSVSHFLKKNINPVPGMFVEVDGGQAKVQSVSGGRVRIDFNHPLAGKELLYKLKITEEVKKPLEKAKELLDHYNVEGEATLEKGKLTVKPFKQTVPHYRTFVDETIRKWIKEITKVEFLETKK
jgi:FKBP-type peptidyl-prolyl cis-trans isomerase 2